MQQIVCSVIKSYQRFISPLLGQCCRFHPSCSQYALEAIEHYGLAHGLLKSSYRLCRCHPFSKGGFDPILPKKEKQ